MVLTLEPDLEAALKEEARKLGIAPEDLARYQLRQRFLPHTLVDESRDDWERQLRQLSRDCGVALSHEAVSSEGIYE